MKDKIEINANNLAELFSKNPEVEYFKVIRDGRIFVKVYENKKEFNVPAEIFVSGVTIEKIEFSGIVKGLSPKLKKWQYFGNGERKEISKKVVMNVHYKGIPDKRKFTIYTGSPDNDEVLDGMELLIAEIENKKPQIIKGNLTRYEYYTVNNADDTYTEIYCRVRKSPTDKIKVVMFKRSTDKEMTYCR